MSSESMSREIQALQCRCLWSLPTSCQPYGWVSFYEDDDYRLLTCISRRLMHWKGGYLMEIRLQFDFLIATSLSMGSTTINTRPTMVNCDIIYLWYKPTCQRQLHLSFRLFLQQRRPKKPKTKTGKTNSVTQKVTLSNNSNSLSGSILPTLSMEIPL